MQLKEAYSFFMLPFRLAKESPELGEYSLWQQAEIKVERDILFPYIQNWMQASANKHNRESLPQSAYNFDILTLKPSAGDNDNLRQRLADIRNRIRKTVRTAKTGLDFRVMQQEADLLSVKLFVNRQASVGLLIVPVSLEPSCLSMDNLISLNYALAKTDAQAPKLITPVKGQKPAAKGQEAAALQESSDKGLEASEGAQEIDSKAQETPARRQAAESAPEPAPWTMPSLMADMLADFGDTWQPFNRNRLRLFTYLRVGDTDRREELETDFLHIVRCENPKYVQSPEHSESEGMVRRTFKNIYIGASVEGGGIMTLSTPDEEAKKAGTSQHIMNFATASLSKRYLWVWIMVLLQRHILLELVDELTRLETSGGDDQTLERLHAMAERVTIMKTKTHFSDISDFTQHNQYYAFCVRNLLIREHFDEIGDKLAALDTLIASKASEGENRRNDRMTIILAILTIASVTCDAMTVLTLDRYNPVSGLILSVILILLLIYVWKKK
ncbi:MAG: hypothetical protein K6F94_08515 [Bacteroidaceae bacterium]|nr:hypothetical protein [Bacteroidaceae bacterium]